MPDDAGFQQMLEQALAARRAAALFRQRRVVERAETAAIAHIDGRQYVNFSSNDYLGLRNHPAVVGAAAEATRACGAGSGASALVTGYTSLHADAERALADWKGTESAVLLPSGYQANHATIQAIALSAQSLGRRVRFVLDKLVHASLIDAVAASNAPVRIFPHNGIDKLSRLLDEADADEFQIVVTESIFSMTGDAADLCAIVELKQRRPFVLVVDEAHGSGVYGENGSGLAAECGVARDVDVFIITLSKALGSIGGAVCASTAFCESLVNLGRAYIYSTAVPPAVPAALMAGLNVLRSEPQRQRRVRALARQVRDALRGGGGNAADVVRSDSPIIPVMLGDEGAALVESQRLLEAGLLVIPIRPPTVPRGTSRLRITLSCEHTNEQVEALASALARKRDVAF